VKWTRPGVHGQELDVGELAQHWHHTVSIGAVRMSRAKKRPGLEHDRRRPREHGETEAATGDTCRL
jgi:hypothetical protein